MKKLMSLILMAMLLVTAIPALAEEAAEPAAVSTTAYIFWQDADWWPAVSSKEDDYWAPAPVTVTGEGYYTVSVTAHMPSWFYSGGNHNRGAQKLAIVVADGNDLFPGMFMQVTDVRVNGVSYPCGDVTYGQTGYDNIAEDGTVFWDANDTYGLIYDQWMIDNGGTIGTGNTWSSSATAQKFDVFDVNVLDDPQTIEIDFFLSTQQDVKPAGGPALRVINEGPESYDAAAEVAGEKPDPANSTTATLFYWGGGYWPITDGSLGASTTEKITGEGSYTLTVEWIEQKGDPWNWTPTANGANKLLLIFEDGKNGEGTVMDGMYVGISDIRVNGTSIPVGNAAYGPTWYDMAANGMPVFDANDSYVMLYDQYQMDPNDPDNNKYGGDGLLVGGHQTWDGSTGVPNPVDPADLANVSKLEVDFFVTSVQGQVPAEETVEYVMHYYPNNTMGVAGVSLRDRGMTDKWYNVVPVDLSTDGIQSFPLIASNMYVIGDALVSVSGDEVTVDYVLRPHDSDAIVVTSECVKWFDTLEEITDEFCQNPTSDLAFGQAISKSELGKVGYLFICNRVNYRLPVLRHVGVSLPGYYTKQLKWQNYFADLEAVMALEAPAAEEAAETAETAEPAPSPEAEEIPVEETEEVPAAE